MTAQSKGRRRFSKALTSLRARVAQAVLRAHRGRTEVAYSAGELQPGRELEQGRERCGLGRGEHGEENVLLRLHGERRQLWCKIAKESTVR